VARGIRRQNARFGRAASTIRPSADWNRAPLHYAERVAGRLHYACGAARRTAGHYGAVPDSGKPMGREWSISVWRNHNLSIVLTALFLFCLVGHAWSGWKAHNDEQRQHGAPEVELTAFLSSSEFGETVFENWESEFLQMGFYVILTVFLYQRGSSESKKHDGTDAVEEDPELHRDKPDVPAPVKAGGWRLSLYKNSLSLAFLALFLVSFVGHAASGVRKHNLERKQHGEQAELTLVGYLQTPQFWYESFQNWQSEFLAVLAIVVLSIWLRQWGSPESKPVHAAHHDTGNS
jgi:hypothetical protein